MARWRADKWANDQLHQVVKEGKLRDTKSQQIRVGDIILIKKDEPFPADLIFLSAPLVEGHHDVECYIETANLDGETALKPKRAIDATGHLNTVEAIMKTEIEVIADPPNRSLVQWEGQMKVHGKESPLSLKQFLFRGCVLRNTEWILGAVCYAGKDTKMMRNLKARPSKRSIMEKKLNNFILFIFLLNVFMCFLLSLLAMIFKNVYTQYAWYIKYFDNSNAYVFFTTWLSFFLLLSYMIPISLFVTIEICKASQAKLMQWDLKMFHNSRRMVVKSSSLNEDLGLIRYIFTDKTGTLTDNLMVLAGFSVMDFTHNDLVDPGKLNAELQPRQQPLREAVLDWIRCVLLCNTCVLSRDVNGNLLPESQSQDEVALVKGLMSNGYFLTNRNSRSMTLSLDGQVEEWTIEGLLEFDSDRKRMSIIVRKVGGAPGPMVMYTKGADSTMLPLMEKGYHEFGLGQSSGLSQDYTPQIRSELDRFSRLGLRTLVMAMRYVDLHEYTHWKQLYDAANLTMGGGKARQGKITEACTLIEKAFNLLGCSAIEDKLQDQVPETIHFFMQAGVVVWMLTGDKMETAVNIAGCARLKDHEDRLCYISGTTDGYTREVIGEQLVRAKDWINNTPQNADGKCKVVLVMDGPAFAIIEEDRELQEIFHYCAVRIKSAICCRLEPLQKAHIVDMFQSGNKDVCLGIGDGANDVSMIQSARVGVGVMGLEGSQAELASDYAIPRFRHLVRLCAVHGRFSSVRNAFLIQYSFYKNNLFAFMQFYFGFYSGFSGQTLTDEWLMANYNLLFTQLPPLVGGIFEKDIEETDLEKDPLLFKSARLKSPFNVLTASMWMFISTIHSIIIYYSCWPVLVNDDQNYYRSSGLRTAGLLISNIVLTVVLSKACLHLKYWTWITFLSAALSFALYMMFVWVYNFFGKDVLTEWNFYYQASVGFADVKTYLYLILYIFGIFTCLDYTFLVGQQTFLPTYADVKMSLYKKKSPRSFILRFILMVGCLLAMLIACIVLAVG
uniref:Phospholipid-transporting ATPase n=1 Tax=Eutreptiella gymnastica TaxID=73025 RepID=A0A7S1JAI8_9EUGL